jgi:predicted nucleotidyltransferase
MLLKFTKNQILILEIFFNHPERSYYLRELALLMGKEPGVFQKDINKLIEKGILEDYFEANRRFFKLNKKSSILKELKLIFFKTLGIKGRLGEELKKIPGIKEAFIYGSFARGEEKTTSDVDLFIIGSIDENKLIDMIIRLEKKFNREINYSLMTEKEFEKKLKEKKFIFNQYFKTKKNQINMKD